MSYIITRLIHPSWDECSYEEEIIHFDGEKNKYPSVEAIKEHLSKVLLKIAKENHYPANDTADEILFSETENGITQGWYNTQADLVAKVPCHLYKGEYQGGYLFYICIINLDDYE